MMTIYGLNTEIALCRGSSICQGELGGWQDSTLEVLP